MQRQVEDDRRAEGRGASILRIRHRVQTDRRENLSAGKLRIGIDVGGTHTDSAILDGENHLVHATKTQTTADVTAGVVTALQQVVREAGIDTEQVEAVMFGTTHCTNAVVERKGLARTGLIRLGSPATHAIKPLLPLPRDL